MRVSDDIVERFIGGPYKPVLLDDIPLSGKIDRIDYKHGRLFVSGLNIYKRHTRPDGANQEGGIVDKVMPMNWSNVQLMDPKEKKPTRVGYREENGRKVRFAKASGTVLEG